MKSRSSTSSTASNGGILKYLTFIRSSEKYRESPPPAALLEAMGKFVQKSFADGTLVDTGGLPEMRP